MKFSALSTAALAASAAIGTATAARAATITQTVNLSAATLSGAASASSQPTGITTASFPAFNTSLGTLTGVSFAPSYNVSVIVTGPGGAGGVSDSGPLSINGTQFTNNGTSAGLGGGGGGQLPATFTFTVTPPVGVVPDNIPLSTYLSPYTFAWSETASLSAPSTAGYSLAVNLNSGSVVATYTYTAVPEPTSAALAAAAVAGLTFRRRRKRA